MNRKIILVIIAVILCTFADEENPYEEEPKAEESTPVAIKIGALFDINVDENKQMFQYAIEYVNENLLAEETFRIEGEIADVDYGNDFNISRGLCGLLEKGIAAVFGPDDESSAVHAANLCDTKEIPYIDTRYDISSTIPIVNMYPDPTSISQMMFDLVVANEWTSFTILYETPEWLPRMYQLLAMYDPKGDTVTEKRIDVGLPTKNYRSIFREVKLSGDVCIVIECSIESLGEILKQAQQIGLMVDTYHFIITNLDAHTIDLEPYQYSGAKVTTMRIVDTSSPHLVGYADYVKKSQEAEDEKNTEEQPSDESSNENANIVDEPPENGEENRNDENTSEANEESKPEDETVEEDGFNYDSVRLQTALIYDAVILLADTFKQLGVEQIQPTNVYCMGNDSMWEKGTSISNFLRNTAIEGITKSVQFDENGRRSNVVIQISTLNTQGTMLVGTWDPENGIKTIMESVAEAAESDPSVVSFRNRTFIVLTALTAPYGMLKDSSLQLVGNERFEGFGIDIIHELHGKNWRYRFVWRKSITK